MKEILIYVGSTLLVALISWAVERLIAFLNSKIKNQKIVGYLSSITNVVVDAVKATQQEFVDTLKKTGEFTSDAQIKALEMAKNKILFGLTEETKNFIKSNYGSLDEWLETAIHSALYDLKK